MIGNGMRRVVRTLMLTFCMAILAVGLGIVFRSGFVISWNDMIFFAFAAAILWLCLFVGDVIIDLDANHNPVWAWNEFNHMDINRQPFGYPDWTHTNAVIFPAMLAVRALQRARGLPAEADATGDIAVPAAPVNAALSALLFLESLWLQAGGSNAFGSSLVCLARKPEDASPR